MKTILKLTAVGSVIAVGTQFGVVAGIVALCVVAALLSPVAQHCFAAIDIKPSTVFGAGYDAGTHTIIFNTNDATSDKTLPQLTDAEADPDTGDARAILFAMCEKAFQWYNELSTGDKPKKLTITRSQIASRDGTSTNSYTLKFTVTPPVGQYSIPTES